MDHSAAQGYGAAIAAFYGVFAIFGLLTIVLSLVVNWKIASKAGYDGAMSLLMLIPVLNVIVLILFAFRTWPIEERVRMLEGGAVPGQYPIV